MKKKIIYGVFAVLFLCSFYYASVNNYQYVINAMGGIRVGLGGTYSAGNLTVKSGSKIHKVDSITVDNMTTPTLFKLWSNNTQLIPDIPAAGYIDLNTVYGRLLPDTVHHAANYTLGASDVYKEQHCNKATSIVITVPVNFTDMPVGSTMNFYGEGAGIMVFKFGNGSNVIRVSDKDSTASSRKGQVIGLRKEAANKYFLYGTLTD
jgi:hypothetical protein